MRRLAVLLLTLLLAACACAGPACAEDTATEPVFENGLAQPVFDYESVIREIVYVES